MTFTTYKVTGRRAYRGHKPGEEFDARLDQTVEHRAVTRGDIIVIDRMVPDLPSGSYKLPPGWADRSDTNEAPHGASSLKGACGDGN